MNILSPRQCKAARALLDLSQDELAARAGVAKITVRRLEDGEALAVESMAAVCAALEAAGVQIIAENGGGEGARLAKPSSHRRKGR